jgi:hypothetical protein
MFSLRDGQESEEESQGRYAPEVGGGRGSLKRLPARVKGCAVKSVRVFSGVPPSCV